MSTWEDDGYDRLAFGVAKSRRYHAMMRRFYETCHQSAMAINVVFGTSTVGLLIGGLGGGVAATLAGLLALTSALEIVYRPSQKATEHAELCRRFTELASKIARSDATPKVLARLTGERLEIEAAEPPPRRLVDFRAYNEECRSRGGDPTHEYPLRRSHRLWGHVLDLGVEAVAKERERNIEAERIRQLPAI